MFTSNVSLVMGLRNLPRSLSRGLRSTSSRQSRQAQRHLSSLTTYGIVVGICAGATLSTSLSLSSPIPASSADRPSTPSEPAPQDEQLSTKSPAETTPSSSSLASKKSSSGSKNPIMVVVRACKSCSLFLSLAFFLRKHTRMYYFISTCNQYIIALLEV